MKKEGWIIGISKTGADGVVLHKFLGTESDVKARLVELVTEDAQVGDGVGFGSITVGEVEYSDGGFNTCCGFHGHYITYSAKKLSDITEI